MGSSVAITPFDDARLGGVLRAAGALPLLVNIARAALPPQQHISQASCVLGMREQGHGIGGTAHVYYDHQR